MATDWVGRTHAKMSHMKKETSQKIKKFVHANPEIYMPKSKTSGYNCPLCGNGTGKNGTGAESKDGGIHFTCFRCGKYKGADIFEIMGLEKGVSDFPSKFKFVVEKYKPALLAHGFTSAELEFNATPSAKSHARVEQIQRNFSNKYNPKATNDMNTTPSSELPKPPPVVVESKKDVDVTKQCNKWHESIGDTDYLTGRGLSQSTLDHFNIGFCKGWIHPDTKVKRPVPQDVVIIPTSQFSYLARGVKRSFKFFGQFGNRRIFNTTALYNSDKPVFVVESEIDAMSIWEVGGQAVALGGVGQVGLFLKVIKEQKPTQPLIISLDDDVHGKKAQQELRDGLVLLGIPFQEAIVSAELGCKDANEALVKDRATFTQNVSDITELARCAIADQMDTALEEIRTDTVAYALDGFLSRIEASKNSVVYATKFPTLNNALDGGLYAGLYVVGAISSLGKTTFCLQLADQLAMQGHDVLVFSLEMSRDELIAKSISRLTFLHTDNKRNAKTTRGILTGSRYDKYNNIEKLLIRKSIDEYRSFGHRLYIEEGLGNITTTDIRNSVTRHYMATGRAPIVVVDYLQIIAPTGLLRNPSDKQVVDRAVLDLKILSRDFNTPVIAISSFNRSNYETSVNLASFKESGAIEYSSDVLIGLQYKGMGNKKGEFKESPKRKSRVQDVQTDMALIGSTGDAQEIEVKILKNRNGSKGSIDLYFFPMFNCFAENKDPHETWVDNDNANNDDPF